MYHTRLQVICDLEFSEILMAEIGEAGFDTFMETEQGFEAFAEGDSFDANLLEEIKNKYAHVSPLLFFQEKIQKKNWNEEWEKSLEPIIVEDQCLVRAEFHKIEKKYPYEIVITPKMSFGTGHHQTTYLMLKAQMQLDHKSKRVMDAGCGTAILSIMASKLGATEVEAFDIDEWSVINGKENIENNKCTNIRLQRGKVSDLNWNGKFELILANINKNILLEEMRQYALNLQTKGMLLLSGFYMNDIADLEKEASLHGFEKRRVDEKDSWATLLLEKVL